MSFILINSQACLLIFNHMDVLILLMQKYAIISVWLMEIKTHRYSKNLNAHNRTTKQNYILLHTKTKIKPLYKASVYRIFSAFFNAHSPPQNTK